MPFITHDKTNIKYLLIVVVLVAVVGGGVLWISGNKNDKPALENLGEPQKSQADLKTKKIAEINYKINYNYSQSKMSPNGQHFAYVVKENEKMFVVYDDKIGKKYDDIFSINFSPDSEILVYDARIGEGWEDGRWKGEAFLVINNEEQKKYEDVGVIGFSSDSKHLLYRAEREGKELIVLDGQEGRAYDYISDISFSDNGKHYIYAAREADRYFMNYDGEEMLLFTEDDCDEEYLNKVCADQECVGSKCKSNFLVEQRAVFISPDGQHTAYIKNEEGSDLRPVYNRQTLFLDGNEVNSCTSSGLIQQYFTDVYFSPNSTDLAYKVGQSIFRDGEKITKDSFFAVGYFTFSPNSEHYAYRGREKSGECTIVLDGREFQNYKGNCYSGPIFAPDNESFAYVIETNEEGNFQDSLFFYDGKDVQQYTFDDSWYSRDIMFSADSQHVACYATKKDQAFIILDGKRSQFYDKIFSETMKFSENGKYFEYGAILENGFYWITEAVDNFGNYSDS